MLALLNPGQKILPAGPGLRPSSNVFDPGRRLKYPYVATHKDQCPGKNLSAALARLVGIGDDDGVEGPVPADELRAMQNSADATGPADGVKAQIQQGRRIRRTLGQEQLPGLEPKIIRDKKALATAAEAKLLSVGQAEAEPHDPAVGILHGKGPGPGPGIPPDPQPV